MESIKVKCNRFVLEIEQFTANVLDLKLNEVFYLNDSDDRAGLEVSFQNYKTSLHDIQKLYESISQVTSAGKKAYLDLVNSPNFTKQKEDWKYATDFNDAIKEANENITKVLLKFYDLPEMYDDDFTDVELMKTYLSDGYQKILDEIKIHHEEYCQRFDLPDDFKLHDEFLVDFLVDRFKFPAECIGLIEGNLQKLDEYKKYVSDEFYSYSHRYGITWDYLSLYGFYIDHPGNHKSHHFNAVENQLNILYPDYKSSEYIDKLRTSMPMQSTAYKLLCLCKDFLDSGGKGDSPYDSCNVIALNISDYLNEYISNNLENYNSNNLKDGWCKEFVNTLNNIYNVACNYPGSIMDDFYNSGFGLDYFDDCDFTLGIILVEYSILEIIKNHQDNLTEVLNDLPPISIHDFKNKYMYIYSSKRDY